MNILPKQPRRYFPIGRHGHFLVLGIALCSLSAPGASAQQSAPPPAVTAASTPTAATAPHDALSDDTRLAVGISLVRRRATVGEVLQTLTTQTHVALICPNKETLYSPIALSVQAVPMRDVLRSLAALEGGQWKRVTKLGSAPTLLLDDADDPHRWDHLRPGTQAQADEGRAVQDFQSQIAGLPPQMQQALGVRSQGVPFSDLPAGMQQSVRDALTASNKTTSALLTLLHMPSRSGVTPDNVDSDRLTFRVEPGDGVTEYRLNVGGDAGSTAMGTTIPDDPRARDVSQTMAAPGQRSYYDVQHDALRAAYDKSRAEALKNDPRMKQLVSLKISDVPFGFVLSELASLAHVNIVADVFDARHTVSLASVPLGDALDQIASKYHAMWGTAPDGTILMHDSVGSPAAQKTAAK